MKFDYINDRIEMTKDSVCDNITSLATATFLTAKATFIQTPIVDTNMIFNVHKTGGVETYMELHSANNNLDIRKNTVFSNGGNVQIGQSLDESYLTINGSRNGTHDLTVNGTSYFSDDVNIDIFNLQVQNLGGFNVLNFLRNSSPVTRINASGHLEFTQAEGKTFMFEDANATENLFRIWNKTTSPKTPVIRLCLDTGGSAEDGAVDLRSGQMTLKAGFKLRVNEIDTNTDGSATPDLLFKQAGNEIMRFVSNNAMRLPLTNQIQFKDVNAFISLTEESTNNILTIANNDTTAPETRIRVQSLDVLTLSSVEYLSARNFKVQNKMGLS